MLIKEPVREAVQEAFEQEREERRMEGRTTTLPDEQTTQSGSRGRRVLGISVVLIAMVFLLRRRTQLREAMPFGETSATDDPARLSGEQADSSTSSETRVETTRDTR